MNYEPLVSVIIPAYNAAKFVWEAVDSVLAQTCQDFEIIIVDDGSTDKTGGIADGLVSKFPDKVRVIHQQNKGQASARNEGIKKARGMYIAFIDADDLWSPEKLKEQIAYLEQNQDYVMVFTDAPRFGAIERDDRAIKGQGFIFEKLLENNFIATSTVMIKREAFDIVGHFDQELIGAEDYDEWLRIAVRYKIGYIPKPLVRYRTGPTQYTVAKRKSFFNGQIKAFEKNLRIAEANGLDVRDLKKKTLYAWHFSHGWTYFQEGEICEARKEFKSALECNPFGIKTWGYYFLTFMLASRSKSS